MDGERKLTRCPYCHKVIVEDLSIVQYYRYKGSKVRITKHCEKDFITTDYPTKLLPDRYHIPEVLEKWTANVVDVCENYAEEAVKLDEEGCEKYLLDKLREQCDVVDEYLPDFKMMLVIVYIRLQGIYAVPLTDAVREKMEPNGAVAY